MPKNFGTKLQQYAQGESAGCPHPIKDVDDNDFCHACGEQVGSHRLPSKDETISAQAETIREMVEALKGANDLLARSKRIIENQSSFPHTIESDIEFVRLQIDDLLAKVTK